MSTQAAEVPFVAKLLKGTSCEKKMPFEFHLLYLSNSY
jgi:hypothetical protein